MFNIIGESCFQIEKLCRVPEKGKEKRGNKIYADGPELLR